MNRDKLKQEGEKWVEDGIITSEQLHQILGRYKQRDPYFLVVLFAALMTGLGILTFIMSDWAQVPHFSRIIMMMVAVTVLYILGDRMYRKRSAALGASFILLGYISFGAGMLLTINIYNISIFSAWPFVIWMIIGLILYFIYEHPLLLTAGFIVAATGQLYSLASFSSFDWMLLIVFVLGFAHFTYHHARPLYSYLFGFSLLLQFVLIVIGESQEYYWIVVYFLLLYLIAMVLPHPSLKQPFTHTALLGIFIFGMYQSFLLQETFFVEGIIKEKFFIIIWVALILIGVILKWVKQQTWSMIDFVLFLPVFYLPFSYMIGLISLFVFSLGWLFIGYHVENHEKIVLGTIGFLLSTFTVYVQFAWEAMNKSLFFLVGGLLLFGLSFILERQRRQHVDNQKGDAS
ncbi:DUF2157 domain-containing protein [Ornithinibacillus gellani]|uniref:DUF2157 domain-containing protein n=1 Tax=Ornithinibacillus gellani TaxID=2293253 RepID=UPI000F4A9500|nr:DUF2157 domain-containing protein [Ornithinibacillus gellani]TQS75850.1 DUF2157 domain-containing protein [Ornithinibacillus gellani]